jgi:hypothetical protein
VGNDRVRAVRDGLFAAGKLVNVAKIDGAYVLLRAVQERRTPRLFLADDPTLDHLRQGFGAGVAQPAPPLDARVGSKLRRAPCRIDGAGVAADTGHPQTGLFEGQS